MNKFEKFLILIYPKLRKAYKDNLSINLEMQNKKLKMDLLALKVAETSSEEQSVKRMADEKFI